MSRFIIYGLVDPETARLRYVGKSSSGLKRPARHMRPCELRAKTHKNNWVNSLLRRGLRPEVVVLEYVQSGAELSDAEIHWIAVCRGAGIALTNGTAGGDGTLGTKKSDAFKAFISQHNKGQKWTPEQEARFRLAIEKRRGQPLPPEQAKKCAAALRSPKAQEAWRVAMAARRGVSTGPSRLKGRKLGPYSPERIAAAAAGVRKRHQLRLLQKLSQLNNTKE